MCVVSMVMDSKWDDWTRRYYQPFVVPVAPGPFVVPIPPMPPPLVPLPTQQELDEFRRLLDRAREYDRKNNEPDCELEEKKRKLRDLAETLGVKIDFV